MSRQSLRLSCLTVLIVAGIGAHVSYAEQDSGTASEYPWSGYWWAHSEGGLTEPLAKYDKVYRTKASDWEHQKHVNRGNIQPWFGHCHAWSAAAVTEKEPREQRDYEGVQFGIGDQKGLLTALHAQDEANMMGDRFGDGGGSEDKADLPPDEVWRLLQLYVRQKNIPLIFDLEAGSEVWNFPVFQYEVNYQEEGNGWVNGSIDLVAADDDVHPDYLGTQPRVSSYTFRCRMQGGSIVSGSGQWTGESVDDHPDFAWYPYVSRAENPYVDPANVSKIVGFNSGGSSNPPSDDGQPPSNNPPGNGQPPTEIEPPPVEGENPGPANVVDFDQILSAVEMVSLVTNKTSHFGLDIFVDRNDGGRYRLGEDIRVAAESDRAGYLYLFDIDPKGQMRLVYPQPGEPHLIPADKLVDIPSRDLRPYFTAEIPGEHHLRGVVTLTPLMLTGFHTQTQGKWKNKGKKPKHGVQKLRVPPATAKRITNRLMGYYTKNAETRPTDKVKSFAQDDCLFYVESGE